MQRPFYECPQCGFFHPAGFNGTCDDTENRYDLGQLEEDFAGWQEVDPPLAVAEAIEKPNLHRLQQLHPEIDLNGNHLEIGCPVRVYTGGHFIAETDTLAGISASTTPGQHMEGALQAIGYQRNGADVAAVLTGAADFLQQRGWHRFTRDKQGRYVSGLDNGADAFGIDHAIYRAAKDARDRDAAWAALEAATAPDKPLRWSEAEGRTPEQVIELLRQCAGNPPKVDDPTPYYVIRTADNGTIRVVVNGHPTIRCTNKDHLYLPGESCPSFIVFRL